MNVVKLNNADKYIEDPDELLELIHNDNEVKIVDN
jgi:hypothetical protein